MNNRSITVIIIVILIVLIYYYPIVLRVNSDRDFKFPISYGHLVCKLGDPSYIDSEIGCIWQSNELLRRDHYFQKIGLIKDSVVIWTPINIFAHVNRSHISLTNDAYAIKLRKLLSALQPGMVSFDPVKQIMMVNAPYLGQALAAIYLVMKMTAGEIKYDPGSNRELVEKITLATIPGHNTYDHLMEAKMDSYIRDYILAYC